MKRGSAMLRRLPNGITALRLLGSVALGLAEPDSAVFLALYLFCGASDMLDGLLARRLRAETPLGAALDSIADLCFFLVCAWKLLPRLAFPAWLWGWAAAIAAVKLAAFLLTRQRRLDALHTPLNRLTGLCLFLSAPFLAGRLPLAIALCALAALAAAQELLCCRRAYRHSAQ